MDGKTASGPTLLAVHPRAPGRHLFAQIKYFWSLKVGVDSGTRGVDTPAQYDILHIESSRRLSKKCIASARKRLVASADASALFRVEELSLTITELRSKAESCKTSSRFVEA